MPKSNYNLSQIREVRMVIEIDPRLDLCYKLAEKDRDTYSPQYRESLDRVFLRLIDMCEKSRNLAIEDLRAEFKHIAESVVSEGEQTKSIKEY